MVFSMIRRDCSVFPNLFGKRNNVSPRRMIGFGSNTLVRNPIILQGEKYFSHVVLPLFFLISPVSLEDRL